VNQKKKERRKEKKRGAHKKFWVALFCVALCLIQVCCSLPYLLRSALILLTCLSQLMLGTHIGQQREQVLWTIIQYCYMLLSYVPHIYLFCAFPKLHIFLQIGTERGPFQSWCHLLTGIMNQPPVTPTLVLWLVRTFARACGGATILHDWEAPL
jgi:hypothetical protein